ncbi:ATP-binding protein [Streptomyces sp. NPDC006703]|uniref:ATP-binding protein n=1 Tax=Streptomyces sp. NPDC006703 TaxID=3364759 RepID=UPI0036A9CC51
MQHQHLSWPGPCPSRFLGGAALAWEAARGIAAPQFLCTGTAVAVANARHQIVAEIRGWGLPVGSSVVETVALVTSELLTNAVQHAGDGPISVAAQLKDDTVRVEVSDSSPALPTPSLRTGDDEHGRGLFIVGALAVRHDVETTESGKRCWAEIPVCDAPTPHAPLHVPLPRR